MAWKRREKTAEELSAEVNASIARQRAAVAARGLGSRPDHFTSKPTPPATPELTIVGGPRVKRAPRLFAPPRSPQLTLTTPAIAPDASGWVKLLPHAYVMGCHKRTGLVLPYLADQSHTLHIGLDYELPSDVKPLLHTYGSTPLLSNYRVFRGHQDMMGRFLDTRDAVGLFFEDDAVPNCSNWVSIVNEACQWVLPGKNKFDVLNVYGRSFDKRRFEIIAGFSQPIREILKLRPDVPETPYSHGGRHHVYGSLAYVVNRVGAERIASLKWSGIPVDVAIPDNTNFAFVHPSPFNHDRSQGSLLYPSSCVAVEERDDPSLRNLLPNIFPIRNRAITPSAARNLPAYPNPIDSLRNLRTQPPNGTTDKSNPA